MCAGSFALLPASSEEAHSLMSETEAEEEAQLISVKHGRYESKDDNGKLKSVVNYEYGKKHGASYLYYPDGKVLLEMTYNANMREGTSKKYYRSGELYATTPYVNNKVEGIRKTFFESGALKSKVPYHNSWPGKGLREFSTTGTELYLSPGIKVEKRGVVWMVEAQETCRKAVYYVGQLIDGKYLDKRRLIALPSSGDKGVLDLRKIGGEEKAKGQEIICKCTTRNNNPLIVSERI